MTESNPTRIDSDLEQRLGEALRAGQNTAPTLADVERVITEEFDERTWDAAEAVLAAHATLLLNENVCTGLMLVGPSGSGKTTVLRFFEDNLDEMIYRSDSVTPRSFVSGDASKSEEQLEEIDLLPRIKQKSLMVRDMATWFAGDMEDISERMGVMANLLDGEGYTRDTGSHGRRGYTGPEYRFNFLGATTPLSNKAWKVMGNVGNRLVFHERNDTPDMNSVIDAVVEGSTYDEKITRCQTVVRKYLEGLWAETGGFASINWTHPPDAEVKRVLGYLTSVVQYGRAPVYEGSPHREGAYRLPSALWAIARGHALLEGRRRVELADMEVCARIALSTMPEKRRPLIRALLNPESDGRLTAADAEEVLGVSRPTALNRMDEVALLGFGICTEDTEDGRGAKILLLRGEFAWPDLLEFPEF